MRMDDAFPSKYLKATDVPFPRTVQMIGARFEEVGQNKEKKMILYFQGEPKGLVVNKTIWGQIGFVVGSDDTDHWTGKAIEIFQDLTRNPQGQQVPCVRVRKPQTMAPQHSQPQQAQQPPQMQGQAPGATPPWSPMAGVSNDEIPDPGDPMPRGQQQVGQRPPF